METPLTAPCVYCGNDRPIEAELCPTCGRGWIDTRIEAERSAAAASPDEQPDEAAPDRVTPQDAGEPPSDPMTPPEVAAALAGADTDAARPPQQLGFDPDADAADAVAEPAVDEGASAEAVDAAAVADPVEGTDAELAAAAAGIAAAMRSSPDETATAENPSGDDELAAAAAGIAAAMRRSPDEPNSADEHAAAVDVAAEEESLEDGAAAAALEEPVGASLTPDADQLGDALDPADGDRPAHRTDATDTGSGETVSAARQSEGEDTTQALEEAEATGAVPEPPGWDPTIGEGTPPDQQADTATYAATAAASTQYPFGSGLEPLPPDEEPPNRRGVQTVAVIGVVILIVGAWFFVLALITRSDGGDIEAQPPGVTLPDQTTPGTAGSAAPGTTAAPSTTSTAPTTTTPPTTVTTLPPTTIPQLEAVGDPLTAAQLGLGGFALGSFNFGSSDALGRLVATYGQPDGYEATSTAWGTCDTDTGFVTTWGPFSAIFLGDPDASELVGFRLGSGADHPASELATLSGLQVGDSIAELESIYRRFSVQYEEIDGSQSFILTRDTDRATLLWGPVSSSDADGIVEGIYSPRPCDGGPVPS